MDRLETLIETIFDRLSEEADHCGGALRTADLRQVKQDLKTDVDFIRDATRILDGEQPRPHPEGRHHVFHRIMVGRFEDLLPRHNEDNAPPDILSRKFLPGFFVALDKMLGQESIAEYEQRCESIVERLIQEKGDAFNWQDVFKDKDVNETILDPLTLIASYFERLDRRTQWFIDLVNSHLPETGEDLPESQPGGPHWHLSNRTFYVFLDTIFSQFRDILAGTETRAAFERRYGERTALTIAQLLGEIEQRRPSNRPQPG